jgi:hypothetical protein
MRWESKIFQIVLCSISLWITYLEKLKL